MALSDILGSILGGSAGKDEAAEARSLGQASVNELRKIRVPTVEEQQVLLQHPELVGLLQAEQLAPSSMESVSRDPRLAQASMKALEQLAGLSEIGLGAQDLAAMQQAIRLSGSQAQAQKNTLEKDLANKNMLTSGALAASRLSDMQRSSENAQQAVLQQAAQAAQARREALSQYGSMANTMGQQDFANKTDIARARDAINQFNAQNRQNVNQSNLNTRQSLEGQRAATVNQQELYNKGLKQQQFQNELSKSTGIANVNNNLANTIAAQGQAAAQGQSQMMGSLINAGASLGSAYLTKNNNQLSPDLIKKKEA